MHLVVALLKIAVLAAAVWLTVRAFCCSTRWGLLFLILPFAYGWLRPHAGGHISAAVAFAIILLFARIHWREARTPLLAAVGALLTLAVCAPSTVRVFFP